MVYSSSNLDPPFYFEGDPMAVRNGGHDPRPSPLPCAGPLTLRPPMVRISRSPRVPLAIRCMQSRCLSPVVLRCVCFSKEHRMPCSAWMAVLYFH